MIAARVRETHRARATSALGRAGLVAGLALAGVWLFSLTRGTTFWQDEWVWVLYRRGNDLGTFLRPHNQHLSLVPLIIYRLLLATAGMAHYAPFRIAVTLAQLACVTVVFVYCRRRVGLGAGIAAAALILFFGPAWGNILWPFQLAWLISLASGVGTLLLLDRADRAGDAGACALLAVSLASSGVGLPIMLAVAVELIVARRWSSIWALALPAVLYGGWWLTYQQSGRLSRVGLLPHFVANEVASVFAALVGLAGNTSGSASGTLLTFGRPLAVIAVIVAMWRLWKLGRVSPRLLGLAAALVSFWVLAAVSRAFIGPEEAWASRYLYVGGLLIVLMGAELARGTSVPRPWQALIAVCALAAVISNIGAMATGGRYLRAQGQMTRAEIGVLDLTRGLVKPTYVSLVPNFPFDVVLAGPYFSAERAYGSPGVTPTQIAGFSEAAREAADTELIQIHHVALVGAARSGCAGATGGSIAAGLPAGVLLLSAGAQPATVAVRRFAARGQTIGRIPAGTTALLRLSSDAARLPWHVLLTPPGRVRSCRQA